MITLIYFLLIAGQTLRVKFSDETPILAYPPKMVQCTVTELIADDTPNSKQQIAVLASGAKVVVSSTVKVDDKITIDTNSKTVIRM